DTRLDRLDTRLDGVDARFDEMDARFTRFEERLDDRIDTRIETAEHRIIAAMRGEFIAAVAQQTRTMIFALIGSIASISMLAFALAALA
ncbi:MAG: hypothetical protein KY460_08195, partial [Actinobacteria bacterium]|nr:hypothetical protein [Actinomycetota bacterium]